MMYFNNKISGIFFYLDTDNLCLSMFEYIPGRFLHDAVDFVSYMFWNT